jgi:hypothetical protein
MFKQHKTSFITLREQFDTTTAAGELMVFNLINFAQFERKQTAERIAANWQSRAKRGLWNGGSIPFGFDRNDKNKSELLPHPVESKQIKEIFELFLKIGSVRQTCLELTKQGIFTKRFVNKHGIEKGARQITVTALQRILTNRAYIGIREIGVSKGKTLELVKATWEPLVSDELFQQVQERLALNKNKLKPYDKKTYAFPLTELLVCGECGKHLGGKSGTGRGGKKHFYYGHPRQLNSDGITHLKRCQVESVRVEKIEDILLKSLKEFLSDEQKLDHFLEIYLKGNQSGLPAVQGKLKTLQNDILTLERRNQNLVERLSELPKEVSTDHLYKQMKANAESITEHKIAIANLKAQENQMAALEVNREGLIFKIRRTVQNLGKATPDQQRAVYGSLIKFAEIHSTKIKLGVYAPVQKLKNVGFFERSVHEPNHAGSCTVLNGAQEGSAQSQFEKFSVFASLYNNLLALDQFSSPSLVVCFHLFLSIFGHFSAKIAPIVTSR